MECKFTVSFFFGFCCCYNDDVAYKFILQCIFIHDCSRILACISVHQDDELKIEMW
jgi:hypothetical protein